MTVEPNRRHETGIPMVDLRGEIDELWPEISEAVERVLRSGRFVLGPEGAAFEEEVAAYLGVAHAIGVNSGTDALLIGLRAAGIGPGDEVITTTFTFFATVEAIILAGATPVFVDIGETGFNIDATSIERAVTKRTKAILPVHLFGDPAPMDAVMRVARAEGLLVVEDCAQAFGASVLIAGAEESGDGTPPRRARAGTLGDVGAFSFYPTKNLGAFGDAGLVVTNDTAIAERARGLRNHAEDPYRRYEHGGIGYNSRLDEIQAAILRVKLPHVDGWNDMRRDVARRYDELLGRMPGVKAPERTPGHVYHQYTVRVSPGIRGTLQRRLAGEGIASSLFYPPADTAWPAEASRGAEACARARQAALEVTSLPMHARLTAQEQERVGATLRGVVS